MATRRYDDDPYSLLPESDASFEFGQDESAPMEVGPTDELPFRYTQQAMNPRAQATTGGAAERTPVARSAFTGRSHDSGGEILYRDMLPMRSATVAEGRIDQYKGLEGFQDIYDPYSIRGREAITQLKGFEGPTIQTNVFDMQRIGKSMGFDEDKINQLTNLQREQRFTLQEQYENKAGAMRTRDVGQSMTEEQRDAYLKENPDAQFRSQWQRTSDIKGNIGAEEEYFRGLMRLSDQGDNTGHQKDLAFKWDDPRMQAYVAKLGRQDLRGGGAREEKDVWNEQQRINRRLRDATDPDKGAWKGKLAKAVVLSGLAAIGGAALGPAVAAGLAGPGVGAVGTGIATGAVAGGIGTTAGQLASGRDFNLQQIGKGVALGGALGGISGGISNMINGPGVTINEVTGAPDYSVAPEAGVAGNPNMISTEQVMFNDPAYNPNLGAASAGPDTTGKDVEEIFADPRVQGTVNTGVKAGGDVAAETLAEKQGLESQLAESRSAGQKRATKFSATRRALDVQLKGGLFGTKLPSDDPYYDIEEDLSSVQQGVF